jgi:hypothetical protein
MQNIKQLTDGLLICVLYEKGVCVGGNRGAEDFFTITILPTLQN